MSDSKRERIEKGRIALKEFIASERGGLALLYLRSFTIEVPPGPHTSAEDVRHHLGKCALVKQIENLPHQNQPKNQSEAESHE